MDLYDAERLDHLRQARSRFNTRQQLILDYRFGLQDGVIRSIKETTAALDCTPEELRAEEREMIRELRRRR